MEQFEKEAKTVIAFLEAHKEKTGTYPKSQIEFYDLLTAAGIPRAATVGSGRWIYHELKGGHFWLVVPQLGGERMQYPNYYYSSDSKKYGYDT